MKFERLVLLTDVDSVRGIRTVIEEFIVSKSVTWK